MSVITIFSGTFCEEESVVEKVLTSTGFKLITDDDIVNKANRLSGIAANKLKKAFLAKESVFNNFTHEKELSSAWLKLAVAESISEDKLLLSGFAGQLVPKVISHVLKVCIIAEMKFRISNAIMEQKISEKEAVRLIHRQDEDRLVWINTHFNKNDPWDSSLYDLVVPMDKMLLEKAVSLIVENAGKDVVKPTELSRKSVEDFLLASQVEVKLATEGHNVDAVAKDGEVTIIVNKHVFLQSKLEEELKSIADKVQGVKSVETKFGEGYYQTDIYRKYDFKMPSKVLLVDDEREFVQTLSERLILRDMGSVVAYDGESALSMVTEDEPDVMILDLKMPGIDGIEVLKRVKKDSPDIEVIILTGHGTDADEEVCMKLGAFAYLQKPVDIEILSDTLKKANDKIRRGKASEAK
ncbi:MAG: response regulator [Proteobacteria bacterium]|nr:response regulator [Pseudomonadota bacterium]